MSRSSDIIHYLPINASIEAVFKTVSTARGISRWWSSNARGHSELGSLLELEFTKDIHWQAQVTQMVAPHEFELTLVKSDPNWEDSRVGFYLSQGSQGVDVKFYHNGWKETNDHYYISCYCWAMYLRIMKRFLEFGEVVAYDQRLIV